MTSPSVLLFHLVTNELPPLAVLHAEAPRSGINANVNKFLLQTGLAVVVEIAMQVGGQDPTGSISCRGILLILVLAVSAHVGRDSMAVGSRFILCS